MDGYRLELMKGQQEKWIEVREESTRKRGWKERGIDKKLMGVSNGSMIHNTHQYNTVSN